MGTKHGCRQVIICAFDEGHYVTLRDEDTFYKFVSPLALLAHVGDGVGGLEVTNVVALLAKLPNYWAANPRVPQFIMRIEEAQKNAARAGLLISGAWLAVFGTSSLLLANSFPNDRPVWDGKGKDDQTWDAWKTFSIPLHKNLERKTRLARGEDFCGTAAAAQAIHNVEFNVSTGMRRTIPGLPTGANLADNFDAQFNSLVTSVKH